MKFRSGWDEEDINAPEFAKMCIDSGAQALAIHARTQKQMYRGNADWDVIRKTKEAIAGTGIPLWGNGDKTTVGKSRFRAYPISGGRFFL